MCMKYNIGYILLFTLFAAVVAGYALFRFSPLITGPQINVIYPESQMITDELFVDITMETTRVTDLYIQGFEIDIDSSEVTVHRHYLSNGNNSITIEGCDQYDSCKQISLFVYKK